MTLALLLDKCILTFILFKLPHNSNFSNLHVVLELIRLNATEQNDNNKYHALPPI